MRRFRKSLVFTLIFLTAVTVSARQYLQADHCVIDAEETIVGTLFVFCQNLVIDGVLNGNLIGAATNTIINGEITNGVYLIGSQLDLLGIVNQDIHYIGLVLNIHDSATFSDRAADIFSLTMSTELEPGVQLPGSIVALGYQLLLGGSVGGEVNFWGSALEINGIVTHDVTADVGDSLETEGTAQLETLFIPLPVDLELVNPGLRITANSEIGGSLRYRAPSSGIIAGQVLGETYFEPVVIQAQIDIKDEESLRLGLRQYAIAVLREFMTLLVVGAFGLTFTPGLTQSPIRNLRRRPLTSLGVGTLTFILSFPVVVIAVVVSVFAVFVLSLLQAGNLTLAALVVVLLVNIGGASLFYFVAIFVARSVVCLAFGRGVIHFIFEDDNSMRYLYVSLTGGALFISMLVSLPVVGWILNALTLFIGLGAIVTLIQAQLRTIRETVGYGDENDFPPDESNWEIDIANPHITEEAQPKLPRPRHTVGTDNLPPDFVWWDDNP